jgi:hypothetical protein
MLRLSSVTGLARFEISCPSAKALGYFHALNDAKQIPQGKECEEEMAASVDPLR